MKRILARISYDGSGFRGYQKQLDARTVQEEVERALARLHKAEKWQAVSSGRTDTGVHALRQPLHFDSPLQIPEERWPMALNSLLPGDIHVHTCREVDSSFHARYDAVAKEYVYRMTTGEEHSVFKRHYEHQLRKTPDQQKMQQAADFMLGTHDFSSLSSPRTSVVDKVRTMYAVDVLQDKSSWTLRFVGSGFLYQMVRVMTGTLLEVGFGAREPESLPAIIRQEERAAAGKTAPGHGLYLSQVFYEEEALKAHLASIRKS
ncbi:MAG: tRNA pseudouridine(38-40) synthase TruA [Alkalicoccus sp.]|nr:MAG: tRNA pseudouridine(38-40) synthase TruA [Alkalicoccus sp.]